MAEGLDTTPEHSPQEGISLDELAQAFAQVMEAGPRLRASGQPLTPDEQQTAEAASAAETDAGPGEQPPEITAEPENADDACPISPRSILEAMLFVGDRDGQPLTAARAAELMRGVEPGEVPRLVDELNQQYAAGGAPYQVAEDGAGYRLTLRPAFRPLRDRLLGRMREARLSQAAIDVLAIVAYQQPLTGEQISRLRGKPSGHVLAQLVHRRLLRIQRQPNKRHTADYYTTDRFLELFGLETLADLPQSEDLDR
jgi:segregation and condensation protein B